MASCGRGSIWHCGGVGMRRLRASWLGKAIGRDVPHAVVTNVRVEPIVTKGVIRPSHFNDSFAAQAAGSVLLCSGKGLGCVKQHTRYARILIGPWFDLIRRFDVGGIG
jgi:hypothetical protein